MLRLIKASMVGDSYVRVVVKDLANGARPNDIGAVIFDQQITLDNWNELIGIDTGDETAEVEITETTGS